MLKIFVVQYHPQNIFNIELFPNYGILIVCSMQDLFLNVLVNAFAKV